MKILHSKIILELRVKFFLNYNKSSKNKGVFNHRKQKNINNKIKRIKAKIRNMD